MKKINLVIQKHSLTDVGTKINYNSSIIMVDDMNLSDPQNNTNVHILRNLLKNKLFYQNKKSFNFSNINFMFSTRNDSAGLLNKNCITLPFDFN